jgi:type I restriction enzyme M protein
MLTVETRRRLDACRDILVGKLPLPTDQIELITLALIYKFMDDLDEESVKLGGKRSFFVGPLEKYRWRALLPQTVSAEERMNLFAEGIESIGKAEHLPALFRDIFRNSFLKFRDGRILTLFLDEMNGFEYSHSEELGNAFEYLLKTMGIQAENGQFRTPRHIINFMVECLDPQPNDRILDPACGTGGFLVSAYKHILAQHTSPGSKIPGDKLTHDQRQKVYSNLTGYDVTDLMVKLSKVNLFLHGFPDPAIHIYDTLTNDARWNDKADVVLANPPFMTPKGGISPHTKFRVSARKSEVLFTDYIAEHLSPDGRGAVIVPNGIVATVQNAYTKLRRFLVEDSLVAAVSLPHGVFRPYSGVKTSILFLDKTLARKREKALFLKINADGFDLGDQRRPISENDLPEAQRLIVHWLTDADFAPSTNLEWKLVARSDLLAQQTILLVQPSDVTSASNSQHPMVELREVCSILNGFAFKSAEYVENDNGLRIIRIANVQKGEITDQDPKFYSPDRAAEFTRYNIDAGDILISLTGNVGRVGRMPQSLLPALLNQRVAKIVPDTSKIDPTFLFHVLNQDRFENDACDAATGAAQQNLSTRWLGKYRIPLPPFDEQRRIVAEIEHYQREIEELELNISETHAKIDAAVDTVWAG